MKTKISMLVIFAVFLSACSKTEVVAPTPIPTGVDPDNQIEQTNTVTGEILPPTVDIPPPDAQGAEVAGKAQDMPEGTKEWEHTSNPIQAPSVGELAPTPESN